MTKSNSKRHVVTAEISEENMRKLRELQSMRRIPSERMTVRKLLEHAIRCYHAKMVDAGEIVLAIPSHEDDRS